MVIIIASIKLFVKKVFIMVIHESGGGGVQHTRISLLFLFLYDLFENVYFHPSHKWVTEIFVIDIEICIF